MEPLPATTVHGESTEREREREIQRIRVGWFVFFCASEFRQRLVSVSLSSPQIGSCDIVSDRALSIWPKLQLAGKGFSSPVRVRRRFLVSFNCFYWIYEAAIVSNNDWVRSWDGNEKPVSALVADRPLYDWTEIFVSAFRVVRFVLRHCRGFCTRWDFIFSRPISPSGINYCILQRFLFFGT